jgi:hypothetical protein
MINSRNLCLVFLVSMIWLGVTGAVFAEEPSKEFWPEVDLWLRLTPAWRISMFVPISKNIETDYREGNLILQADYVWAMTKKIISMRLMDENLALMMKTMMLRGGYLEGRSLGDQGQAYSEKSLYIELHRRMPFQGRVLVSHRLRTDFRWLGDNLEFSSRLRYRLMIEKEFPTDRFSFVPFVSVEPYYDSRYAIVNRFRLIAGTSVAWSLRYALEGNITYQYDSRSSVTNLYALNVILHAYL